MYFNTNLVGTLYCLGWLPQSSGPQLVSVWRHVQAEQTRQRASLIGIFLPELTSETRHELLPDR